MRKEINKFTDADEDEALRIHREDRNSIDEEKNNSSQPPRTLRAATEAADGQSGLSPRRTCADCYEMGVIRTRNSSGLVDLCQVHATAEAERDRLLQVLEEVTAENARLKQHVKDLNSDFEGTVADCNKHHIVRSEQ